MKTIDISLRKQLLWLVLSLVLLSVVITGSTVNAEPPLFIFGSTFGCGDPSIYVRQLVLNGSTTLDAIDSGFYQEDGEGSRFNDPNNRNYIAGSDGATDHHNFFVFEIPNGQTFTSATLLLFNTGGFPCPSGYFSPNPTELYELYDVTTPVATLIPATGTGLVGIYEDLGSGTLFGSQTVSAADNGAIVSISLNADAIAAINSAAGSQFAIGGA